VTPAAAAQPTVPASERGLALRTREAGRAALARVGVVFLLVACTVTYYGQLHRTQSGDVYGTIYTAVALVQEHTIWLDRYLPYIQQRSGDKPYMVSIRADGHVITSTPTASSVLAVPVVAAFTLAGAKGQDWNAWMEASMLTAALTTAASVAIVFTLLTRLTTRRRAALIAVTYAWGTLAWGVSGQALWQQGGAALALALTLLAFIDRRFFLAGLAITAMAAFRLTTPVMAVFLLPLIGRRPSDWLRFIAGAAPLPVALALYNTVAFGAPWKQGYGSAHVTSAAKLGSGRVLDGIPGLLVSPGRGLLLYSPVLLFAIAGAVIGRKQALYRWCAVAFVAYVIVVANVSEWWGGESFGARKLAEALPLLAVLLVPAVDAIVRRKWLWVYLGCLAWSVLVEALAAAAWPDAWFGKHDLTVTSTWWHPFDNETVAALGAGGTGGKLALTALIFALALGAAATVSAFSSNVSTWSRARPRN
jgi:hypothetical protein